MRKKRNPENTEQRDERHEKAAQKRTEDAAKNESDIDAWVKDSIKIHGP
jgi:hypothetical protein